VPSSVRAAQRPRVPTQLQQTCARSPVPSFPNKATWQHAAPWPRISPCMPLSFETPGWGGSGVPLSSAGGFLDGSWRGAGTSLSDAHHPGSGTPGTKQREMGSEWRGVPALLEPRTPVLPASAASTARLGSTRQRLPRAGGRWAANSSTF